MTGNAAGAIEEIFVVAQKRPQRLQDVPVSVAVLSGERLELAGIDDLFEVAREVSSLTVNQTTSPINTSFRVRRIGNEANIPNFEPAVGLFVDGAFRSRSGLGIGDLVDVESVEVVRGPQTTLHGKNTTAGLVSILTRQPNASLEAAGKVSVGQLDGYDSAGMLRASGTISGPLADDLSARLSGAWFG
ncbi:MAG: TonB-dependent receptor plug domain-containing protein, partial [Woeseiaceae bacterium]|nr:TonB-dependent receptor plug domain-containing protein [Woeseiaceae bacterium]